MKNNNLKKIAVTLSLFLMIGGVNLFGCTDNGCIDPPIKPPTKATRTIDPPILPPT